jgi:hypothetical protein
MAGAWWRDSDYELFARLKRERDRAVAERDELRQRIHEACPSPDEGGRIHAGGRIVCGQCHDSEVRHLRNERDEAVRALRFVQEWLEGEGYRVPDDVPEVDGGFEQERMARVVLAKYPEGT